jgi:hypothetical protein
MEINVKSLIKEGVTAFNLASGLVYKDQDGDYVLACDQDYVVVLQTGRLLNLMDYDEDALFEEVSAHLEIY